MVAHGWLFYPGATSRLRRERGGPQATRGRGARGGPTPPRGAQSAPTQARTGQGEGPGGEISKNACGRQKAPLATAEHTMRLNSWSSWSGPCPDPQSTRASSSKNFKIVPESPPSDNEPSSRGSTDPALGLLRDLRDPPLSIWDAKDGTLFRRWRLPIELCSDTARFA